MDSVEKPEAKGHLEGGCTLGSRRLLPGSNGPNAQVLFMGILEAPSASIRMGFGQERSLVSLQSWNGTISACPPQEPLAQVGEFTELNKVTELLRT